MINLGNVVALLRRETAPDKKYVIWAKPIASGDAESVELLRWSYARGAWVPFCLGDEYVLPATSGDPSNTPPVSPDAGSFWLLNDAPTGAWAGHPLSLAQWTGTAWLFYPVLAGAVSNHKTDVTKAYQFLEAGWEVKSSVAELTEGTAGITISATATVEADGAPYGNEAFAKKNSSLEWGSYDACTVNTGSAGIIRINEITGMPSIGTRLYKFVGTTVIYFDQREFRVIGDSRGRISEAVPPEVMVEVKVFLGRVVVDFLHERILEVNAGTAVTDVQEYVYLTRRGDPMQSVAAGIPHAFNRYVTANLTLNTANLGTIGSRLLFFLINETTTDWTITAGASTSFNNGAFSSFVLPAKSSVFCGHRTAGGVNMVTVVGATFIADTVTSSTSQTWSIDKIKDYVATGIVGGLSFKGNIDCSTNPNYPAASVGHLYKVSVAGKIGGASGVNVEVGDSMYCVADTAAGNQATVGANWQVVQANLDGAVIGPASSVNNNLAVLSGTTGKLLADSGVNITMLTTFNAANRLVQLNGSNQYPALSGALITALNASNIGSGTVPVARLSQFSTSAGGIVPATTATTGKFLRDSGWVVLINDAATSGNAQVWSIDKIKSYVDTEAAIEVGNGITYYPTEGDYGLGGYIERPTGIGLTSSLNINTLLGGTGLYLDHTTESFFLFAPRNEAYPGVVNSTSIDVGNRYLVNNPENGNQAVASWYDRFRLINNSNDSTSITFNVDAVASAHTVTYRNLSGVVAFLADILALIDDVATFGTAKTWSITKLVGTLEALANKASDYSVVNNTKYPTTQATEDRYYSKSAADLRYIDRNSAAITFSATNGGTGNAFTVTNSPALTTLPNVIVLTFAETAGYQPTGAATLAIDAITAVDLTREDGTDLQDGDIIGGFKYVCTYSADYGYRMLGVGLRLSENTSGSITISGSYTVEADELPGTLATLSKRNASLEWGESDAIEVDTGSAAGAIRITEITGMPDTGVRVFKFTGGSMLYFDGREFETIGHVPTDASFAEGEVRVKVTAYLGHVTVQYLRIGDYAVAYHEGVGDLEETRRYARLLWQGKATGSNLVDIPYVFEWDIPANTTINAADLNNRLVFFLINDSGTPRTITAGTDVAFNNGHISSFVLPAYSSVICSNRVVAGVVNVVSIVGLSTSGGGSSAWNDITSKPQQVLDKRKYIYGFYDFEAGLTGTPFSADAANSGSANFDIVQSGMHGNMKPEIGLTAAALGGIAMGNSFMRIGDGPITFETLIKISALSNGTDTYRIKAGLINAQGLTLSSGVEVTHGIFHEYFSTDSANWRMCEVLSGTATKTSTSTAVAAGSNIKLRIEVDAAGTSAEFFVNGTSVGTMSGTFFPVGQAVGIRVYINRTNGTSNFRNIWVDYIEYSQTLTTSR